MKTCTYPEATYSLIKPSHQTSTYHLDMKLQIWMLMSHKHGKPSHDKHFSTRFLHMATPWE